MSTPFEAVNHGLNTYCNRFCTHDAENENKDVFKRCMEENVFDENDIEDELGKCCDPNQCGYASALNDFASFSWPMPHYLHLSEHKQEHFIFYILQYIYQHNECPSNRYIVDHIAPLVDASVEHCETKEKEECIDIVMDTEDDRLADDPSSKLYKQAEEDFAVISAITNEKPPKCEPLIALMAAFGGNTVQLFVDLIARVLVRSFYNKHYDLIDRLEFKNILTQFIQKHVKHFKFSVDKLPQYIKALYDMVSTPRFYGFKALQRIMNDILSDDEESDEEKREEKQHHDDDPRLPYDAAQVLSIFAGFMASAPFMLKSYDATYCTAMLILKSPPSHVPDLWVNMCHYIEFFSTLFKKIDVNRITEGSIVYWMLHITDDKISPKGPYYKDGIEDNVSDNCRYFMQIMHAKCINIEKDDVAISILKLNKCIQCNVYNFSPLSVFRIEPHDLWRGLRMLFQYGTEYVFSNDFWADFYKKNCWSDFDPRFDAMWLQFMKYVQKHDLTLFELISGIQRISKKPFASANMLQSKIFNVQTEHRNTLMQIFGNNAIQYLDICTALQLNEMNQYEIKIDGTIYTVSFINHLLPNAKYTIILRESHDSHWSTLSFLTETEVFKIFGVLKNELPHNEILKPSGTFARLQHLKQQHQYAISSAIIKESQFKPQLQQFVVYWNENNSAKSGKKLEYNQLLSVFEENQIDKNYREDHVKRCLQRLMQKNGYEISRKALDGIWNAMKPNEDLEDLKMRIELDIVAMDLNAYVSKRINLEDLIHLNEAAGDISANPQYHEFKGVQGITNEVLSDDEENDEDAYEKKDDDITDVRSINCDNIHVPKYVTIKLLPNGNIDESIRNWDKYTREWLHCYPQSHVIYDKDGIHSITNYNIHRNGEIIYVVKEEDDKHYLKTKAQLPPSISLPVSPKEAFLNPDEREKKVIMGLLEERLLMMDGKGVKWEDRERIPVYGAKDNKGYIAFNVNEFIKELKTSLEDMKDFRVEAVPRFDRISCIWIVDWVLVLAINCITALNEARVCDIGISLFALCNDNKLCPRALYLSIYDAQRLLLLRSYDRFREMNGIKIGRDQERIIQGLKNELKFLLYRDKISEI